jgi:hypothetical protein
MCTLNTFTQAEEIKKLWQIKATGPSSIIELRAIKKQTDKKSEIITKLFKGKDFNSLEDLHFAFEKEALRLNALSYNIYVVMNPINESFTSGSVGDSDIAYRDLLLIDIDRHKTRNPVNVLVPANEDELEAARILAEKVSLYLKDGGWKDPIKVMSGNGYHLLYVLDNEPNTDEVRDDIKGFLKDLAAAFDNDVVKIDTSVFNASRITKVVGTVAYKGEESADRPYRMARCV